MMSTEPRTPAADSILGPQGLSEPERRRASSREPTARAARVETVMAVPNAMATVANMPAQNRLMLNANTSTARAPGQGRIPIENARDQALGHDHWPPSCAGGATCA